MSLMPPSLPVRPAAALSRQPASPPALRVEDTPIAPAHLQHSCFDYLEAMIVNHLLSNQSLDMPFVSGRTPMQAVLDATVAGNLSGSDTLELIRYLRKEGVKLERSEDGVMTLNRVLRSTRMRVEDKVTLAEYLLTKGGANRTQQDRDTREDALFAAVADPGSGLAAVRMLLEAAPPEPMEFSRKCTNSDGDTVLTKLVSQLSSVEDPSVISNIQDTVVLLCDAPALMEPGAVVPSLVQAAGHRDICCDVLAFVHDSVDVDLNATYGEKNMTAMHIAAQKGLHDIAETLARANADVDPTDSNGDTPLILACRHGETRTVAVLLALAANPNVKSELDGTPLHAAVKALRVEVVDELLRSNECVDLAPARVDDDEAVDSLHWPIGINEVDSEGNTVLDVVIHAEQSGSSSSANAELCKLLLAKNAKTASTGPLHQLIKQVCNSENATYEDRVRNAAVVVMLLDANDGERKLIDPNDKVDGVTPLDLLVWKPIGSIMHALLRAGAVLEEGMIQRMLRSMASEDCTADKAARVLEAIAILTETTPAAPVGEGRIPCTQSFSDGEPTLLQLAIKLGLKDVVDVLVTNNVDVNDGSPIFYTLKMLAKATSAGDSKAIKSLQAIIKMLFESGELDCNLPAHEDLHEERTLLEVALSPQISDMGVLELVLGDPKSVDPLRANPNLPSDAPPLVQLFEELQAGGYSDRIQFILQAAERLIRCGARVDYMIETPDRPSSPLKIALSLSEWALARTMIEVGNADINYLNPFYDNLVVLYCSSGLDRQSYDNLWSMIELFFDTGADRSTVNVGEPSALDLAWKTSQWELAQKLVWKGADVNKSQPVFRVMEHLVDARQEQQQNVAEELHTFFKFLIKPGAGAQGADINIVDPETHKTGLGLAIELGDVGLIEYLLDQCGANPREPDLLLGVMNELANQTIAAALDGKKRPDECNFYEHVALLLIAAGANPTRSTTAATPTGGDEQWFREESPVSSFSPASSSFNCKWELRTNWTFLEFSILICSSDLVLECIERMCAQLSKFASDMGRALAKILADLKTMDEMEDDKKDPYMLNFGPAVTGKFLRQVLMMLVERGSAMDSLPITVKNTPFETAMGISDDALCKFLIQQDADLSTHHPLHQLLNEYYQSEDFALYMKACTPRIKFAFQTAQQLMQHNPKFLNARAPSGTTPLELAIMAGDLEMAEHMVHLGADVNNGSPLSRVLQMLVHGVKDLIAKPSHFIKFANLLLQKGADANPEKEERKPSPLQCAITLRNEDLIRKLLKGGADVTSSPLFPITVQHAIDAANLPDELADEELEFQTTMIGLLLEHGAHVEQTGPSGKTALSIALDAQHLELVQLLLDKGAKFGDRVLITILEQLRTRHDPRSGYGSETEEAIADLLIKHGADVNVCVDNVEPLELVVEALHLPMVKSLIVAGSYLRDEHAGNPLFAVFNPLHHALGAGNEKIVRKCSVIADYLIEKGANAHVLHDVLDMCLAGNDPDQLIVGMLTFFGNKGARLNEMREQDGPLLMRCARKGLVLSVDALIDLGAPVRQKRPDGVSALGEAINYSHPQCAAVLLENGADAKELKGTGGLPMVHQSVLHHEVVLLQLLAKSSGGSLKKMADSLGRTVLHYVLCQLVSENTGDSREMLRSISSFANPGLADLQGDTALHIATALHPVETVTQLLGMKGADPICANSRGWSCLDVAALRGNAAIFEALLAKYPTSRCVNPETVAVCAASSFIKGMELCEQHGVDSWDMALWTGAFMGRLDSIVYAIQQGADVNQRDANRRTLLHFLPVWHCRNPSYVATLATPLLDARANTLLADQACTTALHWACTYQNPAYASLLVEHGASVVVEDSRGLAPLNPSNMAHAEALADAIGVPLTDEAPLFRDMEAKVGWGLLSQRPNYRPERYAAIEWCRVSELKPSVSALSCNPDGPMLAADVQVGTTCIDAFTASLMQGAFGADLSGFFVTRQGNAQGRYTLQLPSIGDGTKLVEVVVDDFVPCIGGVPCFVGIARDGTFWPLILRKGFAKLWGSYDALPPHFRQFEGASWFQQGPRGQLNSSEDARLAADDILQGLGEIIGVHKQHVPQTSAPNVILKLPQPHYLEPSADNPSTTLPHWQGWLSNLRSYRLFNTAAVSVESRTHDTNEDPLFFAAVFEQSTDGKGLVLVNHAHATAECRKVRLELEHPDKEHLLALFECDGTAGLWGVRPSDWATKCIHLE